MALRIVIGGDFDLIRCIEDTSTHNGGM